MRELHQIGKDSFVEGVRALRALCNDVCMIEFQDRERRFLARVQNVTGDGAVSLNFGSDLWKLSKPWKTLAEMRQPLYWTTPYHLNLARVAHMPCVVFRDVFTRANSVYLIVGVTEDRIVGALLSREAEHADRPRVRITLTETAVMLSCKEDGCVHASAPDAMLCANIGLLPGVSVDMGALTETFFFPKQEVAVLYQVETDHGEQPVHVYGEVKKDKRTGKTYIPVSLKENKVTLRETKSIQSRRISSRAVWARSIGDLYVIAEQDKNKNIVTSLGELRELFTSVRAAEKPESRFSDCLVESNLLFHNALSIYLASATQRASDGMEANLVPIFGIVHNAAAAGALYAERSLSFRSRCALLSRNESFRDVPIRQDYDWDSEPSWVHRHTACLGCVRNAWNWLDAMEYAQPATGFADTVAPFPQLYYTKKKLFTHMDAIDGCGRVDEVTTFYAKPSDKLPVTSDKVETWLEEMLPDVRMRDDYADHLLSLSVLAVLSKEVSGVYFGLRSLARPGDTAPFLSALANKLRAALFDGTVLSAVLGESPSEFKVVALCPEVLSHDTLFSETRQGIAKMYFAYADGLVLRAANDALVYIAFTVNRRIFRFDDAKFPLDDAYAHAVLMQKMTGIKFARILHMDLSENASYVRVHALNSEPRNVFPPRFVYRRTPDQVVAGWLETDVYEQVGESRPASGAEVAWIHVADAPGSWRKSLHADVFFRDSSDDSASGPQGPPSEEPSVQSPEASDEDSEDSSDGGSLSDSEAPSEEPPAPEPQPPPEPLFRPNEAGPDSFDVDRRSYPEDEPEENRFARFFLNHNAAALADQTVRLHPQLAGFRASVHALNAAQRAAFLGRFFEEAKRWGGTVDPLPIITEAGLANLGGENRAGDAGRNMRLPSEEACDTYENAIDQARSIWIRTLHRLMNNRVVRSLDASRFAQALVSVQDPPFGYPDALTKEDVVRGTLSNSQRAWWRGQHFARAGDDMEDCNNEIRTRVTQRQLAWFAQAQLLNA